MQAQTAIPPLRQPGPRRAPASTAGLSPPQRRDQALPLSAGDTQNDRCQEAQGWPLPLLGPPPICPSVLSLYSLLSFLPAFLPPHFPHIRQSSQSLSPIAAVSLAVPCPLPGIVLSPTTELSGQTWSVSPAESQCVTLWSAFCPLPCSPVRSALPGLAPNCLLVSSCGLHSFGADLCPERVTNCSLERLACDLLFASHPLAAPSAQAGPPGPSLGGMRQAWQQPRVTSPICPQTPTPPAACLGPPSPPTPNDSPWVTSPPCFAWTVLSVKLEVHVLPPIPR